MPIIKPISELRNYSDVLKNVSAELCRGKRSGETQGCLSREDVVAHFRSRVAS